MIRKSLTYLLLLSMTLHCSSRLGLLDQLYQNRHQIGYSLGLLSEIPIAMCSGEYDFGRGLTFQMTDEKGSTLTHLTIANEINLFVPVEFVCLAKQSGFQIDQLLSSYKLTHYRSPCLDIFHPPSTLAQSFLG